MQQQRIVTRSPAMYARAVKTRTRIHPWKQCVQTRIWSRSPTDISCLSRSTVTVCLPVDCLFTYFKCRVVVVYVQTTEKWALLPWLNVFTTVGSGLSDMSLKIALTSLFDWKMEPRVGWQVEKCKEARTMIYDLVLLSQWTCTHHVNRGYTTHRRKGSFAF